MNTQTDEAAKHQTRCLQQQSIDVIMGLRLASSGMPPNPTCGISHSQRVAPSPWWLISHRLNGVSPQPPQPQPLPLPAPPPPMLLLLLW
jgi:hypothetical protein